MMHLRQADLQVAQVALLSRFLTFGIALFLSWLVVDYDSSAEYISSSNHRQPASWVVWDTVYLSRISTHGYEYEQFHAFFPLLPGLLKTIRHSCGWFIRSLPGMGNADGHLSWDIWNTYGLGLAGLVISNVAFVVSCIAFHRLSLLVLRNHHLASLSLLFYSFNPASIFLSAAYTESLFTALTLCGCCCLYGQQRGGGGSSAGGRAAGFWAACVLFGLSAAVRSNGVVSCGFLLHSAVRREMGGGRQRNQKQQYWVKVPSLLLSAVRTVIGCCIVVAPFVGFQYYGYQQYCTSEHWRQQPRPWCSRRLPYLYSFVQSKYWGVGLFRYWTLQQLPNFLLAAPVLALAVGAGWAYAAPAPFRFLTGGLLCGVGEADAVDVAIGSTTACAAAGEPQGGPGHAPSTWGQMPPARASEGRSSAVRRRAHTNRTAAATAAPAAAGGGGGCGGGACVTVSVQLLSGFLADDSAVFVFHLLFLALVAATTMHVQVATRFLSCSPALYWFMAHLCSPNGKGSSGSVTTSSGGGSRWSWWLWMYCFLYICLGSLLFPNFYPWT